MPAASSVDRVRRALLLGAPLALVAPLIGGCTTELSPAQRASALNDRLSAGDRAGFVALFAADPGSQLLAERVFANLNATGAGVAGTDADHLQVSWHLPREPMVVSMAAVAIDRGAIGLSEDLDILVSQEVNGTPIVMDWLIRYAGTPLRRPQGGEPPPDQEFVAWHRKEVFHEPPRQQRA